MSGRSFGVAFFVAMAVFVAAHFVDFRGSVPEFVRASGGGVLLDMKPAFSADALYQRLDGYGSAGRASYAFRLVTVDILLPLALLPFLLLWMSRASDQTAITRRSRSLLLALPIAYVVLDLAENAALLSLLRSFPDRLPLVAALLPYLTVVKRAASLLALFLPLAIYGAVALRTASRRVQAPT